MGEEEREEELKEWVQEMLDKGHDPIEIRDSLEDSGLDPGAVDRAQQTSDAERAGSESIPEQNVDNSQDAGSAQVSGEDFERGSAESNEGDESEQSDAKPDEDPYFNRRLAAAIISAVFLVSAVIAAAAMGPYDIPPEQGGGNQTKSRATAQGASEPSATSGLDGEPEGLQINISESGVQPTNPSTEMETVSFVNKLGRPVKVYFSPTEESQSISPSRYIEANASKVRYFTVATPDGSNVTGSLQN